MSRYVMTLALISFLASAVQSPAADMTPEQESLIKELALEAILENPEIIAKAIERLQAIQDERQNATVRQTLERRRAELERDPNAPVLGNPQGDITMIEFFDYNCPYCKRAMEPVKGLLAGDGGIRLVYREFPILSDGSVFAAKAALAARNQGKYEEMHWALMSLGRADEASTIKTAEGLGLDIDRLRADMDSPEVASHIALSMDLAGGLGITGTPSFVIGDTVVPGLVPLEKLVELVETQRRAMEQ